MSHDYPHLTKNGRKLSMVTVKCIYRQKTNQYSVCLTVENLIFLGTLDFFGLNHYFSYHVLPSNGTNGWLDGDADIMTEYDPSWNRTATGWPITPFGLRKVITWISKEYGYPPIYVTENGYGGYENDGVDDPERVDFYTNYINEMLKSIKLDGSDVKGYAAWSLLDNLEWVSGFT